MGRAVASGQHQAPQGAQWNTGITKPLICMSPYFMPPGGDRFGWFTGGTMHDATPTPIGAGDASNPAVDFLFGGVSMNSSTTIANFDELTDRNSSLIQNDPASGAIVYPKADVAVWSDMTKVAGDGSVKSFSDTASGHRFYRIVTP